MTQFVTLSAFFKVQLFACFFPNSNYPTVNAGEVLTYTIVVANQGRGDINGIAVSDILSDQTMLIPGSIQIDLPHSGIKGTTLPDLLQEAVLQPDEFLTITYAVMVDQTTEDGTFITNEAAVTSNQTPAPITSSVTSIVRAKPNLDMRKFATPTGPVMVGQLITFTIVVSNSGHGPAEDLVITDNLPPSLQFKPGSISLDPPDAGVITGNQPGVVVRDVRIPPGQRVTATIAATVTNHGINGVITNTAYAAASVSDTITIPVEDTPVPILSVTKQASGPQIAGIPFTYTITVTNSSPTEEATGVIIEDTLPIGAEYLSGGRLENENVIWEGITVPANGSQTVTFSTESCAAQLINQQYRVTDSDQGVNSNWGSPLEVDLNEPIFSIDFTFPTQVSEDETISFNSQTSTNGSNIVVWKWVFGDGNTGNGQTVSHTFENSDDYEVTLTVTDACDYEASVTHSISVEPNGPTALYLPVVFKNYLSPPPATVCYTDTFSDSNSGWIIDFSDEIDYSYTSSPPHEYDIQSAQEKVARSVSPSSVFSQYTVKTKARWGSMTLGQDYGIAFGIRGRNPEDKRIENAASIYLFVIDTENNRHFALQKYENGVTSGDSFENVIEWTPADDMIKPDMEFNDLELRCYGSWVAVYVNGDLLWPLTPEEREPINCTGEVGVTSFHKNNTSAVQNARFDTFEICGVPISPVVASDDNSANLVPDHSIAPPR